MGMSTTLMAYVSSHLFGSGTWTKPAALAAAACNIVAPATDTGALTGHEVANAGGYARQTLNPSASNWTDPVASDGKVYNLAAISFPQATADWGWVSGVSFCDSATYGGGHHFITGSLTTPKLIQTLDQLVVPISGVVCTLS